MTIDRPEFDLSQCDREPIHIPGQIQPFGFLIACSPDTWLITHVSGNAKMGDASIREVLGKPLSEVIGKDATHALANALASSSGPGLPGRVFGLMLPTDGMHNAAIHAHGGHTIIELEPAGTNYDPAAPLLLVRSMLMRIQEASEVHEICRIAAQQLRTLIDFDRVMVYQFLHDGSGSVIAESRTEQTPSFLEQHFPASDIPQQARQLYLKNWIRLIADIDAPNEPVISAVNIDTPLDMSFCSLRSVSPIHIEYLRNMDVAASLSISIVVAGTLWGLIACHNSQPRVVAPDIRVAAEFFGQAFSLQLQTLARADVAEMLSEARKRIDRIMAEMPVGVPLSDSLGPRLADLKSLIRCDGAALWFDDQCSLTGSCPPRDEIPRIAMALSEAGHSAVYATHELSSFYAPALKFASEVSGMIAVPLSRTPGHYLMLFRREFERTISWAGNPNKSIDMAPGANRLSPRKSFEIWREEVKNQSEVWESYDLLTCEALRIALLEIVLRYSEIVAVERAKADNLQRLHTAEFNHRVKNALALIGALLAQSKGRHSDLSSFVADLEGRIRSLAIAHDLASRPGKLTLRQLLETELAPFGDASRKRIEIEGPAVRLDEDTSSVLTLVIHELCTNASKHGALSVPTGVVSVRWKLDADGGCMIEWSERDGPAISVPSVTGFGTLLISRQIPFELGGRSEITYAPTGLIANLWLPPKNVGALKPTPALGEQVKTEIQPTQSMPRPLAGHSVLLVEDSLIVALELEGRLRRLGAVEVFVCGTLLRAIGMAEVIVVDFAILDVDLKGERSYPVAEILVRRKIPFAFATGYGLELELPEALKGTHVLNKPYSEEEIARVIELTLGAGTAR